MTMNLHNCTFLYSYSCIKHMEVTPVLWHFLQILLFTSNNGV